MPSLPLQSPGVFLSRLTDEMAIAYDAVTENTHRLNASAAELLRACDEQRSRDATIAEWARDTNVGETVVEGAVTLALQRFSELGLVGRTTNVDLPRPPVGSTEALSAQSLLGAVYSVVDHRIAFRSSDADLLDAIDDHLGVGRHGVDHTLVFDVRSSSFGAVHLQTDEEWEFPSLRSFLDQLVSVLNEYACWTHSCAVLHAGGARSPEGEIVVLAGPSGSGKSTLTGALVSAGWDYLTDEAVGVRAGACTAVGYPKRLELDGHSARALGIDPRIVTDQLRAGCVGPSVHPAKLRSGIAFLDGDVGRISRVFLPRFVADAPVRIDRLAPDQAVVKLLSNSLNLARGGQDGLDAICQLAASRPTYEVTYGDAATLVGRLSSPDPLAGQSRA